WSGPHAWSRKAARSSGEFLSRAAKKIDSTAARSCMAGLLGRLLRETVRQNRPATLTAVTFFSPFGRPLVGQLGVQPGPGERPVALGGGQGDAQRLGRLRHRQPGEEAQLDQLGP